MVDIRKTLKKKKKLSYNIAVSTAPNKTCNTALSSARGDGFLPLGGEQTAWYMFDVDALIYL